ncbi:MAG: sugar phosphate isomerase/epimerase [Chloroflexi bacterium]|nr:MAG: sugar phosphate isomerase/epimerase [Phototrophicales bacterium]RMF77666.1 MAG: sugar phosphate isomerase/epimerase [Chloroflexota bacterium]
MANFKLGVCTWTFGDQALSQTAQRLAALGYDGVELLGDLSLYTASRAAQILEDNGLAVFSLTPANVDIAHPNPSLRQPALDYFFRLLDFAAELGQPLVSCHGFVGRIAPVSNMIEEDELLVNAVWQIGQRAAERNLRIVFEVLNRYETHQIHTGEEALRMIEVLNLENVGVLLDAYHMNIEERNPAQAIRDVGSRLWLYHAADSNRQAVGRGHTDFRAQVDALYDIKYDGPIIIECTAPGPNPFTPDKGNNWREILEIHLDESRKWFEKHG